MTAAAGEGLLIFLVRGKPRTCASREAVRWAQWRTSENLRTLKHEKGFTFPWHIGI